MGEREPKLIRVDGVAERSIAGEVVLVPIRRALNQKVSVLTLNEVGGCVWKWMAAQRTPRELAELVAAEFEIEIDAALADLRAFLDRLQELQLVREI